MRLNRKNSGVLALFLSLNFIYLSDSVAQCNTNTSICTPGTAGPFNFVNSGTPVSSCLDFFGPNTGYIILHITTSGPLNMLIDGNANTGYLDVAVFNIPPGQSPCTAIQNNANEIGCNYATSSSGCNQFGTTFGCNSSITAPNVTAGQELMIVVDNWSGTSNNFTLQLGPAPGAQTGPPNATINPAGPFCSTGGSVQLVAADMGGTWSGPGVSSSGMFNPATAGPGTHTINYTVGTAPCNASSSTTVVVNSPPTLSISPATASVCAGQSVTLTASGAAGYSWNPGGATTASITVSPATTTTYTVTSPGCSGSATRTVNVTPLPNVTVNSPTICAGQTATLTANGATSYTWSAGPTSTGTNTATASPSVTTSYTVTGTTSGCSKTAVSTVTVTPLPTITVNSPTICEGAAAILTAGGGTSYTWSAGATSTGANTASASPAATTSYTVTGTTSGCSNTAVSTVTVNPNPSITVNSATICPGGSATLTASGGTSYSWSTGASTPSITVSPGSTSSYTVTGTSAGCSNTAVGTVTVGTVMSISVNSPSICVGQTASLTATGATNYSWSAGATSTGVNTADASPAATTSYTVTGTTGSCTGTAVATVTVNPLPTVTVNSPTICNGSTATLTANGAATYTWSAGATTSGVNTATANPSATTTYTVTGTNGSCSSTAVSTVTVNPMPSVTVNSPSICNGQTATLTANGATSYTWSAGATSTGLNTAEASPATTTSYTVTGSSAGCIGTAVATVTVAPSLSITVNSPTICNGQTAILTANGATNYTWSAGATSTGSNTADASPTTTTSYTVTGTAGTCSGTGVSTVTVNPNPVVSVNSPTICEGSTANLIANGATTYAWSVGATSTGTNTADANPALTTTYTVTGTTAGCTGSAISTVTVNPIPVVTVNSPAVCAGSTAQLTAGGAASYMWSAGATSTGVNTATASPAVTTTYTVTGTTAGCTNTAVSTVTINSALSVDAGQADSICFGGNTTLEVTPNGAGYTYLWTPAGSLSNPAIFNPVAAPASTTNYSVTVTDANGCSGSNTVTVYVNSQILVNVAGIAANCNGSSDGQTIVIPNGGLSPYTYSWSGGCTSAACNQAAGSYTVTVTDSWSSGCTATGTTTVTEPTAITTTSSQTNVTCSGACNGSAAVTPSGGTPDGSGNYNYSWNTIPVQTTQTATGLCAGTYTCIITDDNGCSPPPVVITITQPNALELSTIPNVTICNGGSTTLTANANGGNGTYTFSWSPSTGLSDATISNPVASSTSTTQYTVTVTDGNLCTSSTSVIVTVNPPLSLSAVGNASICPGANAIISANAINGNGGPYTYLWTPSAGLNNASIAAPTASPSASTTYTVTANDGCSPAVTASVTITVLPEPVPAINVSSLAGCAPLCVNFSDGTTITSGSISSWNWDFGDNTPDSITQNPSHCFTTAGTFNVTLTATSADGCVALSSPLSITVHPIPVAEFIAPASTSIFTPTVQYTDQSYVSTGSIIKWDWAFGDMFVNSASDSSHLQNPEHEFSQVGIYCAELIVTTNNGCQNMVNHCIVIDPEFTFFIPNAFSPNDDGINDEFYGKGENIVKYEMSIYDRWGNLTFYTDDINKHWNGGFNNNDSEVLLEDIYVYVVKITDHHDKTHKYIGTVTIVK